MEEYAEKCKEIIDNGEVDLSVKTGNEFINDGTTSAGEESQYQKDLRAAFEAVSVEKYIDTSGVLEVTEKHDEAGWI